MHWYLLHEIARQREKNLRRQHGNRARLGPAAIAR